MSDLTRATYARRGDIISRDNQELMGICRGIIADGNVCQREADFLLRWLRDNEDISTMYPGSLLVERLIKIFEDGVVDQEESEELLQLLKNLTGESDMTDFERKSSIFGLDTPPPAISFVEESFGAVLAGVAAFFVIRYYTKKQSEKTFLPPPSN